MANPKAGQVTVSASAQALSASVDLTIDEYIVKAATANTGNAFLGPSGVTTGTGHILEPGESMSFTVETESGQPKFEVRPHEIYVIGTVGDKVSWFGG